MYLARKFTANPTTVGETHRQHLVSSMRFGLALLRVAFSCGVHAILPFAFEKSASTGIAELHDRMVRNRSRLEKKRPVDAKSS